jgi:hypothetical protein
MRRGPKHGLPTGFFSAGLGTDVDGVGVVPTANKLKFYIALFAVHPGESTLPGAPTRQFPQNLEDDISRLSDHRIDTLGRTSYLKGKITDRKHAHRHDLQRKALAATSRQGL